MQKVVSLYIPNKIKINEVILGNTYQINYNSRGNNYKFIGKIHFGSTYTDGRYWFQFINVKSAINHMNFFHLDVIRICTISDL